MKPENPYNASGNLDHPAQFAGTAGSIKVRMGVLGFNTLLFGLFPPTCCPCGLGPVGYIVQPYMLLLSLPSLLIPVALPQFAATHEVAYLSLYATNYVLMSYGLGVFVDQRRSP